MITRQFSCVACEKAQLQPDSGHNPGVALSLRQPWPGHLDQRSRLRRGFHLRQGYYVTDGAASTGQTSGIRKIEDIEGILKC